MKTAIITGVTGQDGAYLSRLLLDKQYKVIGLVRSLYGANLSRLQYLNIAGAIELAECDLTDLSQVIKLIRKYKPDEFYNLAAQSSVALSFEQPIGTIHFNINSVLNVLEAIRLLNMKVKFYQASTSEMYGKVEQLPITEETRFHPLSPYAISKVTAHHITIHYREAYNLFASCGILFNHESFLRGDQFFVKKVIKAALNIKAGKQQVLEVGNLDIKRDFGWSEKYVEAMWLMMQQTLPSDYIIASGKPILLRDIVEHVFRKLSLDTSLIRIKEEFFRPSEIMNIYGMNTKAKEELNWEYDIDFFEVLDRIIEEEQQNIDAA